MSPPKLNESDRAFWEQCFIASLSDCLETRDDQHSRPYCVHLAAELADRAVEELHARFA
jgi:hypothetical protein